MTKKTERSIDLDTLATGIETVRYNDEKKRWEGLLLDAPGSDSGSGWHQLLISGRTRTEVVRRVTAEERGYAYCNTAEPVNDYGFFEATILTPTDLQVGLTFRVTDDWLYDSFGGTSTKNGPVLSQINLLDRDGCDRHIQSVVRDLKAWIKEALREHFYPTEYFSDDSPEKLVYKDDCRTASTT